MDLLDTIIRGKDPITGTTTYTNVADTASSLRGNVIDTGIKAHSTSVVDVPASVSKVAESISIDPTNIIKAFSIIAAEPDTKKREQQVIAIQTDIGNFHSQAALQARKQAEEMLKVSELEAQLAASDALQRKHPLWPKYQSDSKETAAIRAQVMQAKNQVEGLSQKLLAENGTLNGILRANDVFLKGSGDPNRTASQKAADEELKTATYVAEVLKKLGANPQSIDQALAASPKLLLSNKDAVDAAQYHATTNSFGAGPYSALNRIRKIAVPNGEHSTSSPARWIDEASGLVTDSLKRTNSTLHQQLLMNPDKASAYFDEQLVKAAYVDFQGDSDNSRLTRLPKLGILKQLSGVAQTELFKTVAGGEPRTEYSMKQLIGFALKDDKYKSDSKARTNLIYDIVQTASSALLYNRKINEDLGLPVSAQIGYRIMPGELLGYENAGIPESLTRRYFDLTKASDVQILVQIATGKTAFGAGRGEAELRAVDPIYKGQPQLFPSLQQPVQQK